MKALKHNTPVYTIIFLQERYWPNEEERKKAVSTIKEKVNNFLFQNSSSIVVENWVVSSKEELDELLLQNPEGFGLLIPISGAVQQWVLKAAQSFKAVGIWAGYVPGLLSEDVAYKLLEANAAPAVADIYSVIKRNNIPVVLSEDMKKIVNLWKAVQAVERMRRASLLLVGTTEDWVISACRSFDRIYKKTGVKFTNVKLEELYEVYESITEEDADRISQKWLKSCEKMVEPSSEDVAKASRLVAAIEELVKKYEADGLAIACFTLLKQINTTSCLALSSLNDSPYYIGACEGDMDSALTLLLMKALTDMPSWMANPMIEGDNIIKLAHCSAPLKMTGEENKYILRNHHESGIGVSPQVSLSENMPVTITRLGNDLNSISVKTGTTLDTIYTPTCRTQLRIKLDSMDGFIEDLLGCHQIVTFGNHVHAVENAAKLMGIEVLK